MKSLVKTNAEIIGDAKLILAYTAKAQRLVPESGREVQYLLSAIEEKARSSVVNAQAMERDLGLLGLFADR